MSMYSGHVNDPVSMLSWVLKSSVERKQMKWSNGLKKNAYEREQGAE